MDASSMGRPAEDQVQFGGAGPTWWSGRRRVVTLILLAMVLAGTGVGLAVRQHGRPRPSAVTVINLGHQLLVTPAGWDLYGLGSDVLVRIQPALGRITITRFPALGSAAGSALVVGRDWALIRPFDNVPGYFVRAGRPASVLVGPLLNGGYVLPGPAPGQLWTGGGSVRAGLMLARWLNGRRTGQTGPRPYMTIPVASGNGYYLLERVPHGVAEAGPQGLTDLRMSSLLAVGPGRVLGVSCRRRRRCQAVVINTATGRRHTLAGLDPGAIQPPGAIAPDGETAAVVQMKAGVNVLELVNLGSGAERKVLAPVGEDGLGAQALAWSPDSQWLFAALSDGRLVVINAASGRKILLGVRLPLVDELAVWPAGPQPR
jgi:hypothetical protein